MPLSSAGWLHASWVYLMYFGKSTRAGNAVFAVLSFLLSGAALCSWATFDGIPPRSELQSASGAISWVEDSRYGIKFGLDGVAGSFNYASKGNAMDLVHDALSHSNRSVVTILYDPSSPSGPIHSNETYYGVFELSIAGKPFRSHDQIAAAWRSDEDVAAWLALFFASGGIYLSWAALRNRRTT